MLCTQGIAYCHDGVYSDCRYIQQYELTAAEDGLGSIQSALISQPGKCDDCHPDCFNSTDRPVDTDLKPSNSSATTVYDADAGGIRILSIVDGIQRGTTGSAGVCGNKKIEDVEQCDDGNKVAGDGCSASCLLEAGYFCPTEGAACKKTECLNGVREGDEQCDDKNLLIGDGCTPFCKLEPNCTSGDCVTVCGDGSVYPGEDCDDGNTADLDGCSATCKLEPGWSCSNTTASPPSTIALPVVIRDFIGPTSVLALGPRHPDFQDKNPGLVTGMVASTWGSDKKPVAALPIKTSALSTAANFKQWYTDTPTVNKTFADTLTVTRQTDGTYVFDSTEFFPLDSRSGTWVKEGREAFPNDHNYSFTSEVRFWFQYKAAENATLSFRGDDDVWVFINGKLAVDIGGVHGPQSGSVKLNPAKATDLGLVDGKLYEAAVFQAERRTNGSNYKLTLGGFFFGRTTCAGVCGNGIVTADEFCDDGMMNGKAGFCQTDCQGRLPLYNASATYWRDYTATGMCRIPPQRPLWGNLSYIKKATAANGGTVAFKIQGAEDPAKLATAAFTTVALPNANTTGTINVQSVLNAAGLRDDSPYLRVTAVLTASTDKTSSPVLTQFDLPFTCVNVE